MPYYFSFYSFFLSIAAAKYRTLITLSTFSTINLEEIQKISSSCSPFPEFSSFPDAPLWLQLYVLQDLAITEKFIKRAESSGYKAIGNQSKETKLMIINDNYIVQSNPLVFFLFALTKENLLTGNY